MGDVLSRVAEGSVRYRWEIVSAIVAEHSASLSVLRLGRFQVLVGDIDLRFQRIKLGILKNCPPIATEILVIRLSRLPITDLFIGWRNFCRTGAW